MAKSRAQRKAERRRRQQQQQARQQQTPADEAKAQHDTQVPESADVVEAELAEQGVDLDELRQRPDEGDGATTQPAAPAPSRADVGAPDEAKLSRRERKRAERERRQRAKESEQRRRPKEEPTERRRRSGVFAFLRQVVAELGRVQWPDRAHLIQASAVTLVFIAVLAAYLGALDVIFNWFVQQLL